MIIQETGFCCVAATEESQAKIDAMTRLQKWVTAELQGDMLNWTVETWSKPLTMRVRMVDGPILVVRHQTKRNWQ